MRKFNDIMKEAMEEMLAPIVFHANITLIKGRYIKVKQQCGNSDDLRILRHQLKRGGYIVLS